MNTMLLDLLEAAYPQTFIDEDLSPRSQGVFYPFELRTLLEKEVFTFEDLEDDTDTAYLYVARVSHITEEWELGELVDYEEEIKTCIICPIVDESDGLIERFRVFCAEGSGFSVYRQEVETPFDITDPRTFNVNSVHAITNYIRNEVNFILETPHGISIESAYELRVDIHNDNSPLALALYWRS